MKIIFFFLLLAHAIISSEAKKTSELFNFEQNTLPIQTLGYYAVFLPDGYLKNPQKKYPLCVILHGSGSDEISHGFMSESFGRKDIIYVIPRAPFPHYDVFIENKTPGFTAWPTHPQEWGSPKDSTFPTSKLNNIDIEGIYLNLIAQAIDSTKAKYRTDNNKVLIFGHSQGAAFAHKFAIKFPEYLNAYIAYAGYYKVNEDNDSVANIFKEKNITPIIMHAEPDTYVEVKNAIDLITYFKKFNVDHKAHIYKTGSHFLTEENYAEVRNYIYQNLLKIPAPKLKGEVIVTNVLDSSIAFKLGVLPGDKILSYDKKKVKSVTELISMISDTLKTDSTMLEIQRAKKKITIKAPRGKLGIGLASR